ncbi:CDP-diacylglycerol diphosphatase [Kaistia dalseonensis]|uniref:CDP-diacylglycerol pyrophosphatase n=1 Tax=Kaistia dalseonensis TaxID=410840 RepID=A0ABU0HA89_9HYPH|nr:CDP-diacylglycerol diphosphatase [Kaistia dalseonensis]MCX5496081.1 CDP-diacylglycerol diphosphatase [Kaistia dalseonensis]MDQ0438685.1 hypothetical protein [Kaistia dalseonensis]
MSYILGRPFRAAARALLALVCFCLALGMVPATSGAREPATRACPFGPDQAEHWISPPEANNNDKAAAQCRSCADPVNASARTCAVYRFLWSQACAAGRCADRQGEFVRHDEGGQSFFLQYDTRHRDSARYPFARGENCRFLLWAIEPVAGIEDVAGYAGQNYWRDAYFASQNFVVPAFPKNDLAFAIQPATTRGQHQFHIHIGTLKPAYRVALAHLARDAANARINGYDFHVHFVAVPAGANPFAGIDVSAIVRSMLPQGSADLPLHGVVAAVTDDGRGLWLLAAERFDRIELNYRQPAACHLR